MQEQLSFGLPKPGKALVGAMVFLGAVWLMFAVGLNWASTDGSIFEWVVGSDDVFRGQVWRLFTNFLVHQPTGPGSVGHILTTVAGLYFLGASLESKMGARGFLLFLYGSGFLASLLQLVIGLIIPQLHHSPYYGGLALVDAVAVAWALTFKNQQVRLFFVLPVSGRGLILFVLALNILFIVGLDARNHEGFVTPFGGMLAGWLFSVESPLRRFYLQWRFKRLQAQSKALRGVRTENIPNLRVIRGGGSKPDKSMMN
jgi:membrane associated rhomboid family serine protease